MSTHRKTIVLGFLGTTLDSGKKPARWERWRPTVAINQQTDLSIDEMVLFHNSKNNGMLDTVVNDIKEVSPKTKISPVAMNIEDPWDFEQVYATLYDFAQQYPFKPDEHDYLIHITTGTHVVQICLFLMLESKFFPGRLLQSSPKSHDPVGNYSVIDLELSKYDALAKRFAHQHSTAIELLKSGIATKNSAFNQLITEIEQVSIRSKAPILLMGQTGAGKSFLAKRVYELKKARHQVTGQFVEVNCATIRGDGAMSALFGHVKGAFTGAAQDRHGWLVSANKGVLFLDEIGELGLDEQAMLLKAIEEKSFYPVGGDKLVSSDFQLIAGTHRDLRKDVLEGRFREDLFARINLWTYELPSLAQRKEDIEPNIDYLLVQQSIELGVKVSFNKEAREAYIKFATSPKAKWSGNFRDLGASILRMSTLAEGGRISLEQVELEILRLNRLWGESTGYSPSKSQVIDMESLDLFDRAQLETVLNVCKASKSLSEAGRTLFSVSRVEKETKNDADRLRKYLAKFNLSWEMVC